MRLSRDVDIVIAELHPSTKVSLARAAASRGFLPIRAAYNAGCGAVGNWLARQPADHLAAVSCLVFAMSAVALAVAHVVAGGTVGDADGDAWQLAACEYSVSESTGLLRPLCQRWMLCCVVAVATWVLFDCSLRCFVGFCADNGTPAYMFVLVRVQCVDRLASQ